MTISISMMTNIALPNMELVNCPLHEYGGQGMRISCKGKAYNVSGNMGLQIEFKDRKKLLIGTNKSHELGSVYLQRIIRRMVSKIPEPYGNVYNLRKCNRYWDKIISRLFDIGCKTKL